MVVFRCAVNILRNRRHGFHYNFHHLAPKVEGLYAFWLNTGACVYVGESGDISQRMYEHRMGKHNEDVERYFKAFARQIEVSYYVLQNSTGDDRRDLETRLIRALRPFTNRRQTNS